MKKQFSQTVSACLVLTGVLLVWGTQRTFAVDCEGKPYGTAGCPLKKEVTPGPAPATCGNGVVDTNEECDLGKTYNGLSNCTSDCRLLYCGDNVVSPSNDEECEPEKEERYVKNSSTGELEVEQRFLQPSCGSVCTVPICDNEGNCSGGCKRKFLKACTTEQNQAPAQVGVNPEASTSSQKPAAQRTVCGDGEVQAGEQCDDGNKLNIDNCTNACRAAACGDSIVQSWEQCDDGNRVDTDACTNDCKLPSCGDGVTQAGEECDDGNSGSDDACTNACKKPRCGDGIAQESEDCDDGNGVNTDACTNDCEKPTCGDSFVQAGEECDDGNQTNEDTCTNMCREPRCGDGVIQAGEDCDDSNRNPSDGCNNLCKIPSCGNAIREGEEECDDGNHLDGDACTNHCKRPRCNDDILQAGEECDDGNEVNDDSCTNNCRIMRCGDAILQAGEQCDGGETCGKDCQTLRPAAPLAGTGDISNLALLIGATGILLSTVGTLLYLRRSPRGRLVAKAVRKGVGSGSIDDIPLDEIEMPWHRWQ